jgi:hypothetical protein
MKDSKRAQIKLRATYYNAMGIVVFGIGGLGLVLNLVLAHPTTRRTLVGLAIATLAFVTSLFLRWLGFSTLRDLDEENSPATMQRPEGSAVSAFDSYFNAFYRHYFKFCIAGVIGFGLAIYVLNLTGSLWALLIGAPIPILIAGSNLADVFINPSWLGPDVLQPGQKPKKKT